MPKKNNKTAPSFPHASGGNPAALIPIKSQANIIQNNANEPNTKAYRNNCHES